MDETYIKVHGQWVYLYRAVDKAGQTVDFFLSRNRDVNAAKWFLQSAMKNTRVPTKITLDAYAASHRAVREMKQTGELPGRVTVRSSQYLNNLVEQDHRSDFWDPVGGEDQEGTVQDGQARRGQGDDDGNCGTRHWQLEPYSQSLNEVELDRSHRRFEFAPEPRCAR